MLGRLHCFSKALIYSFTILGKIARNFVIYFYMHLLKDQIFVKSLYMQLLASLKEQDRPRKIFVVGKILMMCNSKLLQFIDTLENILFSILKLETINRIPT